MSKTYDYKVILAVAVLLGVIGIVSLLTQKPWQTFAGVGVEDVALSTTTPNGVVDLTNLCPQSNYNLASSTTGTLISISLTGANVGSLRIYDATTSVAANRVPPQATSSLLLWEMPSLVTGNATTTSGFWEPGVRFNRGLLVDMVNSAPTTTIAYRCGS